ncbi:cytochrome P450 [Crocosphaera watsonii]|uniref:Putative cytochrome P450 hydroxylase n=1 Tax=Crocosphaera watsonii WH 0401 TaxID=555881 RepID=T2JFS3_CROWT|nr:cytochrome P450 [Crocosphaera watsonii]CCQ63884.1 putative cytochrome P450 hydroxylase [Crocosphaera watsonii WH 0401]
MTKTKKNKTQNKLVFNPFSRAFHNNPYPIYERLRNEDPIHWSFLKAWIITRYQDVDTILKDNLFQVDDLPLRLEEKSAYLKQGNFLPLAKTIDKWLFFQQPPNHTRLRSLVNKSFSPASVGNMKEEIEAKVNHLLDKVIPTGKMDLIDDLASPLPAMTVTNILGLPPEDCYKLIHWSYELFFVFDQPMSLEGYEKQNKMAMEAREYLLTFIANIDENSQGLIADLVKAKDEENKLDEDEILGFCIMLLIVGQETTKSFISNSILALLQHPKKLQELKDNPEIIKEASEELLRYDTPVQVIARLAREDVEIGGKTILKGDKVILFLGGANRDENKFPNPEKIEFQRSNRNLPFGGGIHFCLGAFLARLQGQISINRIVQRLPNLQLVNQTPDWRESITLRGLKSLPLTFDKNDIKTD